MRVVAAFVAFTLALVVALSLVDGVFTPSGETILNQQALPSCPTDPNWNGPLYGCPTP